MSPSARNSQPEPDPENLFALPNPTPINTFSSGANFLLDLLRTEKAQVTFPPLPVTLESVGEMGKSANYLKTMPCGQEEM